jgi:hypothetical protein
MLRTPYFLAASQYDQYFLSNHLEFNNVSTSLLPTLAANFSYADEFAAAIRRLVSELSAMSGVGLYSWACYNHAVSGDNRFNSLACGSVTMDVAFKEYMAQMKADSQSSVFYQDNCGYFGCGRGCDGVPSEPEEGEVSTTQEPATTAPETPCEDVDASNCTSHFCTIEADGYPTTFLPYIVVHCDPPMCASDCPATATSTTTGTTLPTTQEPTTTQTATTLPYPGDEACRTCETICAPCKACVDSQEGECFKCWQCWDYDDDELEDDKECDALHHGHDWDDEDVRCLTNDIQDCRACWAEAREVPAHV